MTAAMRSIKKAISAIDKTRAELLLQRHELMALLPDQEGQPSKPIRLPTLKEIRRSYRQKSK